MYNRYIPQPDGSYQRKHIPENRPAQQKHKPKPEQKEKCEEQNSPVQHPACPESPQKGAPCPHVNHSSAGGFLRNLLPRDFDTGDLLIILLLLVMAGDNEDSRNNALLTLVLYLFM